LFLCGKKTPEFHRERKKNFEMFRLFDPAEKKKENKSQREKNLS
jgi:hypothetical protein